MQTPSTKEDTRQKGKVKSNYLKKKALLEIEGGRCTHCFKRTKVRLTKQGPEYILLCHDCIIERQQRKRKREKPGRGKFGKGR